MANVVEILVTARNATKEGFAAAEAESGGFASKMQTVGLIGAAALGAVAVASVDMASQFNSSATRLITSAGETTKNIGMVKQGMLDMAGQVGMSADDLAKGMYTVESAGFHGADGLVVLKAAAQGAKDENAQLGTVANAVTDVLTDYHLKASSAADVTSKLVTAVSFGKTNFQDFSGAMSVVLPLASSLHISLADVTGTMAEMTAHGISADEAAQQIANTMRHLAVPTKTMQAEFKLLGINTTEVQQKLSTTGLAGTLQWLSQVAEKGAPSIGQTYNQALSKLLGSASGLQVALTTTGENAKATNAAIAGISGASRDAQGNVKGFAEIQATFAQRLAEAKDAAGSLAIQLGEKLLPALTAVLGWLATHVTVVKDVAIAIGIVGGALITYALAAKTAALAQAALDLVLDANVFVLIGIAIAALAVLVIKYHTQIAAFIEKTWKDISGFLTSTWNSIFATGSAIWNKIYNDTVGVVIRMVSGIKNAVTGGFDGWWASHGQELEAVWSKVWDVVSSIFKVQWAVLSGLVKTSLSAMETVWKVSWDLVTGLVKTAWDAVSGVFKVAFSLIEGIAKSGWDLITAGVRVAWAGVQLILKTAWDVIVGLFSVFLDLITGHWTKAGNDLRNLATQIWNNIRNYLSSVWSAIATAAGQIFGHIADTIIGVFNTIKSTVSSIGGDLLSIGKSVINDLWAGIKSAASDVVNWLEGFAKSIVNVFKTVWGWFSPARVFYEGGKAVMQGVAGGLKDHAHTAVHQASLAANAIVAVGAGIIGGGVAQWRALVVKALQMEGLPVSLADNVLYQMQTESGGNPNAVNNTDINAQEGHPSQGLMQVIPSTFAAYHWPGTSNNIRDPLANIAAAINYARHVYGPNLANQYGGIGSGHGYAAGGATSAGWALVGEHGRELVKLPGGATVRPHGATEQMLSQMAAGQVNVTFELGSSGNASFDEFMLTWIREHARTKGGGNVQAAFGRN